ncbi:protein FAR1-RELATED SEQUENCE 5-like [Tasmannia lanceolata]|uniref:protein FAR1-RELATED SEQUENCE 5-like n=1 Tax=Tasmannia lanceolata TaxID=3420 RepID=UPI0040649354
MKDNKESDKVVKRHRSVREGCQAKMDISLIDEKWHMRAFEDDHSHELTSPPRRLMHRSYNRFFKNEACKILIDDLSKIGMKPAGVRRAINVTCKGTNAALTTNQVVSHLRKQRGNNIGKEGVLVAEYFQKKRSEDPNFQFAMELDINGNLRSMFWADSWAREAYLKFNDVIVFDVTYRTIRFKMPFAPFTGVNHHRQSTLFGCALLADEKEDTFT